MCLYILDYSQISHLPAIVNLCKGLIIILNISANYMYIIWTEIYIAFYIYFRHFYDFTSAWFSIVGNLRGREVACLSSERQTLNLNPVSGGQCQFIHLTIFRRFSWTSLAKYDICTKVAYSLMHVFLTFILLKYAYSNNNMLNYCSYDDIKIQIS